MAITQAICNSFKLEILQGKHTTVHEYKIALYTSLAAMDENTASYAVTNEIAAAGGYSAGGSTLAGANATIVNNVAILDFTDVNYTTASFSARGALIYNNTLAGKNAVCVIDFGADYAAVNGAFQVQFPAPTSALAMIRIK